MGQHACSFILKLRVTKSYVHVALERMVQGDKAIGILLADPITTIPGQVASPGQHNIGGAQASPTSQSGWAAQYPAPAHSGHSHNAKMIIQILSVPGHKWKIFKSRLKIKNI